MVLEDQDFKGAQEVGKIFSSFMDKKLLCEYYLDSVLSFIPASKGFLYLVGNQEQLWLEAATQESQPPESLKQELQQAYLAGKPSSRPGYLSVPLIVRNQSIGMACFYHKKPAQMFTEKEQTLALNITYQMAGSLQNILLLESNLKMERLASIGKTTSIVMHELTNILQLAKLADECLRRGLENKNERFLHRGLSGLQKALKEMDGFAYEMLSLTKDYRIKPESVAILKIIEELKVDLQDKADQASIKLETTGDPNLMVEIEPRSLYRAILNMVKNAMEAADKPNAYIRVSAKDKDAETYQIMVEDNGQGMTEEVKARIFQVFFSTKGERGTGLGLMIIDRTIKAHQGQLQVDSTAGQGTCFTITLPKKLNLS